MAGLPYEARKFADRGDIDGFRGWLEQQKRPPAVAGMLLLASNCKDPNFTRWVVTHVMQKKIRVAGYNDALAAALAGSVELLELAVERGADLLARTESRGGRGRTPLEVAAMRGHSEFALELVRRGAVDPEGAPVAEALWGGHFELALKLLEAGAPRTRALAMAVDKDRVELVDRMLLDGEQLSDGAVTNLRSPEMVEVFVRHGWSPRDADRRIGGGSFWYHWSRGVALYEALVEAGARFTAQTLVDTLRRSELRNVSERGIEPDVLTFVLSRIDPSELQRPGLWSRCVDGRDQDFSCLVTDVAAELQPVWVVERLLDAGAPAPTVAIEPGWFEAAQKRALLEAKCGRSPQKLDLHELLKRERVFASDAIAALVTPEGVFGLQPGMSTRELEERGFEGGDSGDSGDSGNLFIAVDDGRVSSFSYEVSADEEFFDELHAALTRRFGPPALEGLFSGEGFTVEVELDTCSMTGKQTFKLEVRPEGAPRQRHSGWSEDDYEFEEED